MTGDKIKKIKTYVEGTHGFLVEDDDEEEVILVMCKDCKYGDENGMLTEWSRYCSLWRKIFDYDWFCADGERRTE